jgi:ATP-dependent RNA helicase DeaD
MLTFNDLGFTDNLLKGIEELGFVNPTPIQEKIIPLILSENKDVVGLAQTGTGKTAAFGLPLLEKVNTDNKKVQVLILSPTRELCIQITNDFKNYSKYLENFKVVPVYGGASIDVQVKSLKKGCQVIVATPGRMRDLIQRKAVNITSIETVVLDEADEMLSMGFKDDLDKILEQTPEEKITLLFSATMPSEVSRIAKNYMSDPVQITVGKQNSGAENVKHVYYQVHARDRYLALKRIVDINPDIYGMVFCRTRAETKEVADKLIKDGYNADALHGDLSQAQRDSVMKKFREKSLQLLIATDVAARGIDVDNISHIINYNLPDELEIYTHRSGRTGRAEKSGISISIVNLREKSKIQDIERIISKKFQKLELPSGMEVCEKQLFKLIDRMERVEVDEEQIAPFMDAVNDKLKWLSKEQIIKRFVSLEFNRFLDYYKDAPDLNKNANIKGGGDDFSGRSKGRKKKKGSKYGYARFFINVGKKDGIAAKRIVGLINDHTRDRQIDIGEIDIKDNFSFFEVDENYAEKVMKSFKNGTFKGKPVRVEPAEKDVGGRAKGKRRRN